MKDLYTLEPLHAKDLALLHQKCFDTAAWQQTEFKKLLELSQILGFGVLAKDEFISFILYQVVLNEAEILTICTNPEFQQQGAAKRLLNQSMEFLSTIAVNTIFLEVSETNLPALKLYSSLGFKKISIRKNYYKQADVKRLDAWVLKINIASA